MNDPHVKAIHYLIEHDDSVDYRNAEPLVYKDEFFRIRVDEGEVILEPKSHYATEADARNAVEGFVRRWEFEAALHASSSHFRLVYAGVDIIDRNPPPPPPGVVTLGPVTIRSGASTVRVGLTKLAAGYPAPPQGAAIDPGDPDASFMLYRLDLYRQGKEPLAGVANVCLTVLERSAPRAAGGGGNKRQSAANHYRISDAVLKRVGMLSARKGGSVARKAGGRGDPFTKEESRFLEAAVAAFVRRAAERAADPNGNLPLITMVDLSKPTK